WGWPASPRRSFVLSLLPHLHLFRPAPDAAVSPGLYRDADRTPAFEVKFLLTTAEAREVEWRLRGGLAPDPHADPRLGGAYRVTSVYFATPASDASPPAGGFR